MILHDITTLYIQSYHTAGFCAQTFLAGAVFQKETWPPHSLNPAAAEAVRWARLFVKHLPRAKL